MKKILLSFLVSGAFVYASAQPTFNFESWTGSGGGIEPTGWISGNALTGFGNPQSVFKDSLANAHSGTYAMKIVTVALTLNPDPSMIPNPIGFAATGVIVGTSLKTGFAYTARPATAEFWYKNTLSGTDTASFFMYLSKWNTSTLMKDTVAWGYWETSAAQATYMQKIVTLTYLSTTLFPDSAGILFSATGMGCMTCGNAGSTLWIDDVSFSGWNGVNEHPSSNDVIVYPNPANEYVNIIADVNEAVSVIAYDVTGKVVSSASLNQAMNGMNRKEGVINTSALPSGVYSYSVFGKDGVSLRKGKFSVVQ